MSIDWTILTRFVEPRQHFVISTHMRPDGDALGSALALAAGLRQMGKSAKVILPSSLPPRYARLDPQHQLMEYEPPLEQQIGSVDAIIVVDTGTWNQLGKFGEWMRRQEAAKLVIDHHLTQDDLKAEQLVDATAEACGRLIHQGLAALRVKMTGEIASLLFIALAMDTGWFHHRNVSTGTFALAAELIAAGASPDQLYQEFFDSNTLGRQRLAGFVLQNLQLAHGERVCHASVCLADYQSVGARPADSEDLVNLTLSVTGVQVGALFLEQPAGGTKVSLRSRGQLDCSKLAERFGGGGHAAAAGAIIQAALPEVRQKILAAIQEVLP